MDAFFKDLFSIIHIIDLILSNSLGLLDYDKNHIHDYFGQYCNHDYLIVISGPYNQKKYSVNSYRN